MLLSTGSFTMLQVSSHLIALDQARTLMLISDRCTNFCEFSIIVTGYQVLPNTLATESRMDTILQGNYGADFPGSSIILR